MINFRDDDAAVALTTLPEYLSSVVMLSLFFLRFSFLNRLMFRCSEIINNNRT